MFKSFIHKAIPPKPYLVLGNRMFLLSLILLVVSSYLYDVGEAFIAVEVGIIHFLYNLRFTSTKAVMRASVYPLLMTMAAVPLSVIPMAYAPITSAIFVFILVLIERDSHHQGVPKYILPLTFLLLSMMMPVDIPTVDLITQRSASVILGILIAVVASTLVWPNTGDDTDEVKPAKRAISSIDVMYSSRKALGIGLLLCLGLFGGPTAALGAYLFMMIHSPFSKNLAPKAWQRFSGTLLGALFYLPVGLMLGYVDSAFVVTATVWVLVLISLYMILVYLEHNYTVATAFIMLLILTVSIGPFNIEMLDMLVTQRVGYTLVGGVVMVVLGLLLPLEEKDFQRQTA